MRPSTMFTLALALVFGMFLSGCNTLQRIQSGELTTTFDRTFIAYSKHLRWGHFRELTNFMMPEHIGPALTKAIQLDDVKVSRVTPIAWVLSGMDDDNDENTVMVGDVVIQYYLVSTSTIHSITQNQTWRHDSENDTWRLDNGLPEFRF